MSFIAAKCTNCGGEIQVNEKSESGFCMYCGGKIIIKEAVQKMKIDGKVQVDGINTADKLAKNGETFLILEEYEKARKTFKKLSEQFPEDYRGWWGVVRAYTDNLTFSDKLRKMFSQGSYDSLYDCSRSERQELLSLLPHYDNYDYCECIVSIGEEEGPNLRIGYFDDDCEYINLRKCYKNTLILSPPNFKKSIENKVREIQLAYRICKKSSDVASKRDHWEANILAAEHELRKSRIKRTLTDKLLSYGKTESERRKWELESLKKVEEAQEYERRSKKEEEILRKEIENDLNELKMLLHS